ncbi:SusE domain-containing protein [Algibacter sp. 2305UL17-15]|uniref:SusE domain-containing protein n=1 Tax=Algibacter sp. 2305UL17-15 TaxID=3231268 RepID=UPI00345A0ED4
MNLYIKKISFLLLSLAFILTACETDDSIQIMSADPAFTLEQPGISTVFLNFGTPTNPAITLSWNDDLTGSTSYDVEMALDTDFTSTVDLGNSSTNFFTINVQDLNAAIRNAGVTKFKDIDVYLRVVADNATSNAIKYIITTYPTDKPELTSPSANDAFVLSIGSLDAIAMTAEWTDVALASDLDTNIDYNLQAAAAGTDFATPISIGTGTNITSITATHSDLNAVAIGIGLVAEVAGDMEMRVVAKNTNSNENVLERISETVTVSVTPYLASFPNLFMVGSATTAGWNPDNNNNPLFRNQEVPNAYVYTGYFQAGEFKLLETNQWQPQWGTNDGSTLAVNTGGGSDPGTFNVATAGYYTYNFTTVGESGTFTVTPFDASGVATYTSIAIIGDATPNGWDGDNDTDLTQDPNNPHLWYLNDVTLTNGGSMLIRANNDWADVWRYTGSTELYGTAVLAGDGNNIPFTSPTGSYDIWFNDLDGSYVIIAN